MSQLTLTLRQPAQIGDKAREDFVLATLDHIPGTVVRGALAATWLARNGISQPGTPQREEFLRLFEGPVRFGALFREGTEPQPLSVVGHKYPASDDCPYQEYDCATDDNVPRYCPHCQSPLEPLKPGLRVPDRRNPVRKKRRTSVALSPGGVALNNQLFTRETLDAGQRFTGTLIAPGPGDLDILRALGPIRVGGRRTTHGQATLTITDGAPPPATEVRPDGKLVIRLRSPGIFTDRHGRPLPEPDQGELSHVLGTEAKVDKRWMRWQHVGGWHVASGLPKPSELAVAPGSAFLVSTQRVPGSSALSHLGARGLGLRRHEGFGDLAPPPVLLEGKAARDERAARQRRAMDSVAALRRLPGDRLWPRLREALPQHAAGDARGTEVLRRVADNHRDPGIRAALRTFLELPPDDAAYVARDVKGE